MPTPASAPPKPPSSSSSPTPNSVADQFAFCEDVPVRVISRRRLREFWEVHARAEVSLRVWYKVVSTATWRDLVDVRSTFPGADQVGRLTVFNIGGNRYRLVALIDFTWQKVFVRRVMTHAEYDDGDWKDDPWL